MSDRLAEYGPLIDAAPTREHLARLRAYGLSVRTIHRFSGVSMKALAGLVWGVDGRGPTERVRQETADQLFAVRPRLDMLAPLTKIGATGTRRRLQALHAVGWSNVQVAERLGTNGSYVGIIARGRVDRVRVRTALAVHRLYDELWDQTPPSETPAQRSSVTRIRNGAARHGWVPPLAWDDDTIDDPDAEPAGAGPSPVRRGGARLPEADELLWLVDECRETPEAIADRFGVTVGGVAERVRHARGQVAA